MNSSTIENITQLHPDHGPDVPATSFNRPVLITLYVIIAIVGTLGNLRVLRMTLGKMTNQKMSPSNRQMSDQSLSSSPSIGTLILMSNLALADLFISIDLSVVILRLAVGQWLLGSWACRFFMTFDGVCKFVSVGSIMLLR